MIDAIRSGQGRGGRAKADAGDAQLHVSARNSGKITRVAHREAVRQHHAAGLSTDFWTTMTRLLDSTFLVHKSVRYVLTYGLDGTVTGANI